jgi:hypothetical protein
MKPTLLLIPALAIALLATFPRAVRGDVLRTLDGKTYEGQIRFDASGDALTMQQTAGSAVRVKLADVLSAAFRATAPAARPAGAVGVEREPIRAPWAPRDVGGPAAGGVRRTATKVTLTAGAVRENSDAFAFFCRSAKGDFELIARVGDVAGTATYGGLMLRGGPEPDAPMLYVGVHAGEGQKDAKLTVLRRAEKGQKLEQKGVERGFSPQWLRAVRDGEFVEVSRSADGQTWTDVIAERVPLPESLLVGVAATVAHDKPKDAKEAGKAAAAAAAPSQATFDSLRFTEMERSGNVGWRGQYFANPRFEEAKVTRVDPAVDFKWGGGSPDPAIPADQFSARWTATLRAPLDGAYKFFAQADDTVNLWVNGQKVNPNGGEVTLRRGRPTPVRLEMTEAGGDANVRLEWQSAKVPREVVPTRNLTPADPVAAGGAVAGSSAVGLRAEYFSDADLSNLQVVRSDAEVNFQQPNSPVDDQLNQFSVRWTGQITPPASGKYTFYTFSDDGVRLWVNNRSLIDNWQMNPGVEDGGTIVLEGGKAVPIRMESFNGGGGWAARLMWEGPDINKQVIPAERFVAPAEAVDTRLLTRDGSELIGITIESLDDTTVRFKTPDGTPASLPVDRVARLSVRPLTATLLAKVPAGLPGVLLNNGDFFEGQVERLAKGELSVNSLIFGPRTFKLQSELTAIVLQDAQPEPADYVVRTIDGSVYMASAVALDNGKLAVTDRAVGRVTVPGEIVRDITYGGARVRVLADLPAKVSGDAQPSESTVASLLSVDGTPVGLPMKLSDHGPKRGLGLMSGAAATFALDGQYKSLLVTVGVPAAMLPTGSVHFVAIADGREVFRSPPMTSLSDGLPVSLKLDKVNALTLKVEHAGGNALIATPGVWGDPLLTKP